MQKESRIYVAGHRGLAGSAIVKKLQQDGFTNIITRPSSALDLRRQHDVEKFFLKERPEYVFLAAAKVGGIIANSTYKAEFIYDNMMIASNVIHSAYISGVTRLLNLGSSCIYPKFASQPLREEYLLTGPLEPTNEPYAIAKIAAIKLCRYYNEQYGTNFISALPTNLYGPNDNYNLETSHLLPALIRKFLLAKALKSEDWEFILSDINQNKLGFGLDAIVDKDDFDSIESILGQIGITKDEVTLWGSGAPYREFLHSSDLASACTYLMSNCTLDEIGECINIGTGIDQTIRETAQLVQQKTGFRGQIIWDTTKPDGTPKKLQDVSRLQSLGWKPSILLTDGIDTEVSRYAKSAFISLLKSKERRL